MTEQRLYRSRDDYFLGGVCAGLAKFFGLDVSLIRLLMVILFLTGTIGFWVYLILWIIIPLEP
jgi:phage shock protein PspC (stress-responsive transcriptional regulator)